MLWPEPTYSQDDLLYPLIHITPNLPARFIPSSLVSSEQPLDSCGFATQWQPSVFVKRARVWGQLSGVV